MSSFNEFKQKYFLSVRAFHNKHCKTLNFNTQKYVFYNRNTLSRFLLTTATHREKEKIQSAFNMFSAGDLHNYVLNFVLDDNDRFNTAIYKKLNEHKLLFHTSIVLGDFNYLLDNSGVEDLFSFTDYLPAINVFIMAYMNKLKTTKILLTEIDNSAITHGEFSNMINHYKTLPGCYINSSKYTNTQNKTFTNLICNHQLQTDITSKLIFKIINENCVERWLEKNNIRYEIVKQYNNKLTLWEEAKDTDGIIITSLLLLVQYFKNDEPIDLFLTSTRGLCIPFLMLPTADESGLLEDLKKYPFAIPIFKSQFFELNDASIGLINNLYINPDGIELPIINNNSITENELIDLFDNEEIPKPKKKKSKKTKKHIISELPVDISDIPENEIIELPPQDEYKSNSEEETHPESEDDEPIILNDIENINNDTVVKYSKQPFTIIFYKYEYISFIDKDVITFMLNELYRNNIKFKTFMNQYNTIRIFQSFHKDYNSKDKSVHFTGVFYNTITLTKSSVYHFYILNNAISSLTTIINIL